MILPRADGRPSASFALKAPQVPVEERSFFRPFPCFGPSPARCRNLFPAFRIAGRCGCPACASSSRLPPKAFRSGPPSYAFCRMSLLPGAVLHKKKAIRKIPTQNDATPFCRRRSFASFSPPLSFRHAAARGRKTTSFLQHAGEDVAFRKKKRLCAARRGIHAEAMPAAGCPP